ncbi:type VI secretion system protein VasD [Alteromonadaceae bacterium Bs31]|nr:type VI secretion system protein VasD [Alteromonadaceae bacterium Bs31]
MNKWIGALAVVASLFLVACDSMDSKVGSVLNLDTDLKIKIIADNNINPDESGKPSPVFVRMYELKSPQLFDKADFISLYEQDKEVLGKDFISKQELKRIAPGDQRQEQFVLTGETQYVAIYAEFFDYENAKYKVVFPVTINNIFRNSVEVRLSGTTVILEN